MALTVWSSLPLVLVFQDQPRVGSAPWMELDPSSTSCSWLCCHEAYFLGGLCLFQASDPTTETSLVGATLPDCTSVYHTQAGWEQQGDLGFLLRKSRRKNHCHSVVLWFGLRLR